MYIHTHKYTCIYIMYRSTEEERFMRPGHHWLCQFDKASNGTRCEKHFTMDGRNGRPTRVCAVYPIQF